MPEPDETIASERETALATGDEDAVRVPEVLDSEDGDRWWVVGHVSDTEARLALLATMLGPDDSRDRFYDRDEAYQTARDATVARRYFAPDPTDPDEERWLECAMADPNGTALTVIEDIS